MLRFIISTALIAGILLASFAVAVAFEESLVMYLPFDDETAKDATGNGNDATINGVTQWVEGKFGGALEFKSTSHVEPALDENWWNENFKSLSVFMWVKSSGMVQPIFFGCQDPQEVRLYLAVKDGFWNMGVLGSSWGGGHQGTLVEADTDWHAIAMTMGNGTVTLYVDGEKAITKPYTDALVTNRRPLIGSLNKIDGIGYQFLGMIDEVRVWDKVLTEAEVKSNMEGVPGVAVSPEGRLAAKWGDIKR